jgi:hypothetical protein
MNIRQRLNLSKLNKDIRMLIEEGVVEVGSTTGAAVLTDTGRKVLLDYLWQNDPDVQKGLIKAINDVRKAEKEAKKEK